MQMQESVTLSLQSLPQVPEGKIPVTPPTHPEVSYEPNGALPKVSDTRTDKSAWEMKWAESNNNRLTVPSLEGEPPRGRADHRGLKRLLGRLSRSPDARSHHHEEEELRPRSCSVSTGEEAWIVHELALKKAQLMKLKLGKDGKQLTPPQVWSPWKHASKVPLTLWTDMVLGMACCTHVSPPHAVS